MALGRRPRRVARTAIGVVIAASIVLVACGSPRYHYVKSTSDRTFMRVPFDWTLYDEDELLKASDDSNEAKAQFKKLTWSVAFDAAPDPSLEHILSPSDHPTGLVQVRTLLPEQRDGFSLSDLRSLLLSFDPLTEDAQSGGDVEVLESKELTRDGGLHGNEMLLNLKTGDGDVVKWRQVALVDAGVSKVHVLAISCNTECYSANEGVIDKIVASWKVKTR